MMRKNTVRSIVSILLMVISGACFAESFASVNEARSYLDKIMEKIGSGDVQAGMKMLKPYSIVPEAEFDAMVGQAGLQLPAISQRFGAAMGYEFIDQAEMGSSLARLVYLQKYEKHGMRWGFFLYKGKSGWTVNTFVFDDKIHELITVRR